MRSAHGGGFLYALATKLGITSPDIMIGSSGDAGNVVYFAAGQYESLRNIWCHLVSTSKFISFARLWKIVDVDYLIDEVFKIQDPLSLDNLSTTRIDWAIAVTNFNTGRSRYITSRDAVDIFEALRASKALPVFFGKRVSLSGKKYFDGELGPTSDDHIAYARSRGAERIVLIEHQPTHSIKTLLSIELIGLSVPPRTRTSLLRDQLSPARRMDPALSILRIRPKTPVGLLTRNPELLQRAFELGVEDALAHEKELRTLLA